MKKKPSLIISAGKGCFTCCKGCYQYFGKQEILTDDLVDFIRKYHNKFNLEKITLAGGDPMTRKDIVYLVDYLNKMNINIHMDTVGKNFIRDSKIIFNDHGDAYYVDPMVLKDKVFKIGIPLDGYTTEQINCFRTNITLEETLEILTSLDNCGYNICINTVVNKSNVYDLKKMLSIIKKFNNITQWQLFQYSPIGDLGYKNRKDFEIDDSLFENKIMELIEFNDTNIQIEGKSNSYRKLNYILVNSDGKVWQPNYNLSKSSFTSSDSNSDKNIIGTIYDVDIINKINDYVENINKNIEVIENDKTRKIGKAT